MIPLTSKTRFWNADREVDAGTNWEKKIRGGGLGELSLGSIQWAFASWTDFKQADARDGAPEVLRRLWEKLREKEAFSG